jgi:hypothetical protein
MGSRHLHTYTVPSVLTYSTESRYQVSSADATVTGAKASGGSDAAATGTATSTATGTAANDDPNVHVKTSPLTGVETTPSELYKDFVPLVGRQPSLLAADEWFAGLLNPGHWEDCGPYMENYDCAGIQMSM